MKDYGNGNSTGLEQTAAGKIFTGLTRQDVAMTAADRAVLRALAERVAAIAASARMAETRRLWTRINRLEKTRPIVFCDPEERLERNHHRRPDAVPGNARPPLGNGPPQGTLLGRGHGRRQAGRTLFRRSLHGFARRLGTERRFPAAATPPARIPGTAR